MKTTCLCEKDFVQFLIAFFFLCGNARSVDSTEETDKSDYRTDGTESERLIGEAG